MTAIDPWTALGLQAVLGAICMFLVLCVVLWRYEDHGDTK